MYMYEMKAVFTGFTCVTLLSENNFPPSSKKDKKFQGGGSKIIIVMYEATLEFAQQKRIIELSLMLILVSMIIIGTFVVLTANSHREEFGKNCSRK